MTKPLVNLQDLRRRIYVKAKAEPEWRFWGLYVHVCKPETLRKAYEMAKKNNGAPGIDGETFEAIEEAGVDMFLDKLRSELVTDTYRPQRNRRQEIPKDAGKVRILSIPAVRDRVVQGALRLILEPIFESDFQPGSYGYRPKRDAHTAIARVANEISRGKTRVIDIDLKVFFDNMRHHVLFEKVARRVNDSRIMRLLKLMLKATGKRGVPQGGVISPLLSNIYLNEIDTMLEKARERTRDRYTHIEYARYADDLVILVDAQTRWDWLLEAAGRRLREELGKIQVEVNEDKSRIVDLAKGESFEFLGYEFRRVRSLRGRWRPHYTPRKKSRTALLLQLRKIFRKGSSMTAQQLVDEVNPVLRGWVSYFAMGHSGRCFHYVRDWVEKKMRRHLMKVRKRRGHGWKRWSKHLLYDELGLYNDYRINVARRMMKARAAQCVT
jgi:RNA-directed DNA polymerase